MQVVDKSNYTYSHKHTSHRGIMTMNYLTALFFSVILGVATWMPPHDRHEAAKSDGGKSANIGNHIGWKKQNGQPGRTLIAVSHPSSTMARPRCGWSPPHEEDAFEPRAPQKASVKTLPCHR